MSDTSRSWLRRAIETALAEHYDDFGDSQSNDAWEDELSRIEQVAREFAERALRYESDRNMPNEFESGKVERLKAQLIAEAISAAEVDDV